MRQRCHQPGTAADGDKHAVRIGPELQLLIPKRSGRGKPGSVAIGAVTIDAMTFEDSLTDLEILFAQRLQNLRVIQIERIVDNDQLLRTRLQLFRSVGAAAGDLSDVSHEVIEVPFFS